MGDYKIILYGEFGVGKTSLTTRMLRKHFNPYSSSTVGASFTPWLPDLVTEEQKRRVNFGIWDTAGQERFNDLLPMYLRDADAVFYCWDCTEPFELFTANIMYNKAKDHSPDCHFYLVYTKTDLQADNVNVKYPVAEEWAHEKQIEGYYCTSAKTGDGVQELFTNMAKNILNDPNKKPRIKNIQLSSSQSRFNCCRT